VDLCHAVVVAASTALPAAPGKHYRDLLHLLTAEPVADSAAEAIKLSPEPVADSAAEAIKLSPDFAIALHTHDAVDSAVDVLAQKFAWFVEKLCELGAPRIRVIFDGPRAPPFKWHESMSRRTFPAFCTGLHKCFASRSSGNVRGAVKCVLSVCSASVLVESLVTRLKGRFACATSSFVGVLTIGVGFGEADAAMALRCRITHGLSWSATPDADAAYDGVLDVGRNLDGQGVYTLGGRSLLTNPRHECVLGKVDELDVRVEVAVPVAVDVGVMLLLLPAGLHP